MDTLTDCLLKLFENIPGAARIITIVDLLIKGKKGEIFDHVQELVKLTIIGIIFKATDEAKKSKGIKDSKYNKQIDYILK